MKFNRIRASALTAFAVFALVGMSAAGASAAGPVIHTSGTHPASQTIHDSSANGGIFVGLGNAQTIHETTATGGVLVDLDSGN